MNLRLRDHCLYGFHRALSLTGKIQPASLDQIKFEGFRRILVVATTAIGDAVLCTPLIESLRKALPDAYLGFWVLAVAHPLFETQKSLNVAIPYHGKYRRVKETLSSLKKENFDLALVANANDPDVIPMIWWSGCKRIIRRPQRHTIYSFMIANPEMLNRTHTTGHAIERNLEFCDLIGIPKGNIHTKLDLGESAEKKITEILGNDPGPWWIIHPGASRSKKQWGARNFTTLAKQILEHHPGKVILSGSPSEKEICNQIQSGVGMDHRVQNLAGELKLPELASLIKKATVFISGDTGPCHIAMALGTPTVTLFAPWDVGSSSKINGPFFDLDRHRVVETTNIGDPISTIFVNHVFETCKVFLSMPPY